MHPLINTAHITVSWFKNFICEQRCLIFFTEWSILETAWLSSPWGSSWLPILLTALLFIPTVPSHLFHFQCCHPGYHHHLPALVLKLLAPQPFPRYSPPQHSNLEVYVRFFPYPTSVFSISSHWILDRSVAFVWLPISMHQPFLFY